MLVVMSAMFGALIFQQNILGILGWIALVPLFIALHDLRGKVLFWGILSFGFLWYYLSVFWLHTLVVFHWLIPLGVAVGSLYMGAYFVLFAYPAAWCCRQTPVWVRPWAVAVCWTGVEYLRNFTDMAFPWNLLGHSQGPWNFVHMKLAALGGVSLLSFLMALINASIAVIFVERMRGASRKWRTFAIAGVPFVLFLVLTAYGLYPKLYKVGSGLRVSIVQPGISQLQKWNAMTGLAGDTPEQAQKRWVDTETLMLERLATLTRGAAQAEPQLIVMPESVFMRSGFPFATELQSDLIALSKEVGADLFFGADNLLDPEVYKSETAAGQSFLLPGEAAVKGPRPEMPIVTNSDGTTAPDFAAIDKMIPTVAAWHIGRDGGIDASVYNKMQLVPFGEQVPFLSGVAWLQNKLELAGIAGAYKPGLQNTLFEVKGPAPLPGLPRAEPADVYHFGAVICFESTFSYLTRELTRGGANFICVLTNDSWYDPEYAISEGGFWGTLFRIPGFHQLASAGPKQHLVQSQFRAIETERPIVRSANTGISAFIWPSGYIKNSLAYGKDGMISDFVGIYEQQPTTFFVRYGEWVGKLCLGFWASVCCLLLLTRPKSSGSRFALRK